MLYKRGKRWWVRFTIRGREIRVSSGTDSRGLAEEFEHRLREQVWREQQFGQRAYVWEEATERWLRERSHKRSLDRDRQAFAVLAHHVGGSALADLDEDAWRNVGLALAQGRQPGTVARLLSVARSTLNAAVRWGWLTRAPKIEVPHAERSEPRWITRDQFAELCRHLPPHLSRMARFAVATGLRWSNVSRLRWAMVDLGRAVATVPGGETKTRKAISVPLSKDAREVLGEIQRSDVDGYVFTDHRGRAPVGSVKTAWLKATKKAGLEGFRFHDLRHTWAAWHTLAGTPPIILKELGGWSSLAMVERYAHLNPGHLADWADNAGTKHGTAGRQKQRKHREK